MVVLIPTFTVFSDTMLCRSLNLFFFFNDTATTEIYTLSLHDALPISEKFARLLSAFVINGCGGARRSLRAGGKITGEGADREDRKSTRLNSSHLVISYAVFCLKKKKHITNSPPSQLHSPCSLVSSLPN